MCPFTNLPIQRIRKQATYPQIICWKSQVTVATRLDTNLAEIWRHTTQFDKYRTVATTAGAWSEDVATIAYNGFIKIDYAKLTILTKNQYCISLYQ